MALTREPQDNETLNLLKSIIKSDDQTGIFMKIRKAMLTQGEHDFELEIANHPYGVEVKGLGTPEFAQETEEEIMEWLKNHVAKSDYIFMPTNAMGIYKDRWNWVYFKTQNQAILFKLTWA